MFFLYIMANEAILLVETGLPIPFTVADGTGIEKGAILKSTDLMTAAAGAAAEDAVAGIAATEKIASDGVVTLGVYREGIFRVTLSGSATVGDALGIEGTSGTNYVIETHNISGARVVGYAMETGTTGQTIKMDLNIGSGNAP